MLVIDKSKYQDFYRECKRLYLNKTGNDSDFDELWKPFAKYDNDNFSNAIPYIIKAFSSYNIFDNISFLYPSEDTLIEYKYDGNKVSIDGAHYDKQNQKIVRLIEINNHPINEVIDKIKVFYPNINREDVEKILASKIMLQKLGIIDDRYDTTLYVDNNFKQVCLDDKVSSLLYKNHDESDVVKNYHNIEDNSYYESNNIKENITFDGMRKSLKLLSEMALDQKDSETFNKYYDDFRKRNYINCKSDTYINALLFSSLFLINEDSFIPDDIDVFDEQNNRIRYEQHMYQKYDFTLLSTSSKTKDDLFNTLDLGNNQNFKIDDLPLLKKIKSLKKSEIIDIRHQINGTKALAYVIDVNDANGVKYSKQYNAIDIKISNILKKGVNKRKTIIATNVKNTINDKNEIVEDPNLTKLKQTYPNIFVITYPCSKEDFEKQLSAAVRNTNDQNYSENILLGNKIVELDNGWFSAIKCCEDNKKDKCYDANYNILYEKNQQKKLDIYRLLIKIRHSFAHGHYLVYDDGNIYFYSFDTKKGKKKDVSITLSLSSIIRTLMDIDECHNYSSKFPNIYSHKGAKQLGFASSNESMKNVDDIKALLDNMSILGVGNIKNNIEDSLDHADYMVKINRILNRIIHVDDHGIDELRDIVENNKSVRGTLLEKPINEEDKEFIISKIESYKDDFYKASYSTQLQLLKRIVNSNYSVVKNRENNTLELRTIPNNKNINRLMYSFIDCENKYCNGLKDILNKDKTSFADYNDIAKALLITYFNAGIVYPFYKSSEEGNDYQQLDNIIDYSTINFDKNKIVDKDITQKEIMEHMRNCLAHNNFEFINGLDSKDILHSNIHFCDYSDGKNTFEATFSVEEIMNQVQNKEYQSSLYTYFQKISNIDKKVPQNLAKEQEMENKEKIIKLEQKKFVKKVHFALKKSN